MATASCALCGAESPLQRSHILPEFLYEATVYDEKHRYRYVENRPAGIVRYEQQGLREPLLCRRCERKLGRWETYASRVLYGGLLDSGAYSGEDGRTFVPGVDYAQLKLFLLSLIWRSGVSSLKGFDAVRLGPHEAPLRDAILHEDPGTVHFYPTVVNRLDRVSVERFRVIFNPVPIRFAGHRAYKVLTGNIIWDWIVSARFNVSPESDGIFLGPDGILPIHEIPPALGRTLVEGWKRQLRQNHGRKMPGL